MFTNTAYYYDLIYHWKDYRKEARDLRALILEQAPQAHTLLDVACGTGEHHRYLQPHFDITGLDLEQDMVDIAAAKNPDCRYQRANMTAFATDATYDVVLCMFSSIGYVRTADKLRETLKCFAAHLNPGGIVLVEPWLQPDQWVAGKVHMHTFEREDLKICRMSQSGSEDKLSVLNFHYMIAQEGEDVLYLRERHFLGLFSIAETEAAFREAGLEVEYQAEGPMGRGLFVGRKLV